MRRAGGRDDARLSLHPKQLRFPVSIRPNTSDPDVFCQIFVEQEYACLPRSVGSGLVIDCGANVGFSSAYFLSRSPHSEVIAVEPDADNFRAAVGNLKPYGDRAQVLNAGIWSHCTWLGLRKEPYRDGRQSSRQVEEVNPSDPGALKGVDLPALISLSGRDRVSLLKMDVEGAEALVFAEDGHPESWLHLVDAIVIELHDDSSFGPCSEIFHRAIVNYGFDLSRSGELTVCLPKVS